MKRTTVAWTQYDHLLGSMKDSAIAEMIGCESATVGQHRRKLGIVPLHKTHLTPDERIEALELDARGERRCTRCRQVKSLTEFHASAANSTRNGWHRHNRWCKPCRATYSATRIAEKRVYWLDRAGGECQRCGYSSFAVALDFHHVEPAEKQWRPGKYIMSRPIADAGVEAELDQCALLCCNCHMALERGALLLIFQKRSGLGWTVQKSSIS